MNKTRVDDMLIEMIKPKIEEIEKKFSNQEALTQDDINTLLLKSQYNHINHLDDKLNETVGYVKNLEFKFNKLEDKFDYLDKKLNADVKASEDRVNLNMKSLEDRLTTKMDNLEEKLTTDMKNLEKKLTTDMKNLEEKLTTDMKNLEEKLTSDMKSLEDRLIHKMSNLEIHLDSTIQKALNKNMLLQIAIIGFFFTLIKIIDLFKG